MPKRKEISMWSDINDPRKFLFGAGCTQTGEVDQKRRKY